MSATETVAQSVINMIMGEVLNQLKGGQANQFAGQYQNTFMNSPQTTLQMAQKHGPPSTLVPNVQYFYNEGGPLADCELEAPILNTLIQPLNTIANMIPTTATVAEKVKYAYLTVSDDGSFQAPDGEGVCGDCPEVGDDDFCVAEYRYGRICFQTKVADVDEVIAKASRGVREDLYFVGSIRGVSGPANFSMLRDRDYVKQGAIRRQVFRLAKKYNTLYSQLLWTADPANDNLQSTDGNPDDKTAAWRVNWYGLNLLIADDYDTKTFVTGTDCERLNSLVVDFSGTIGTDNIYSTLQAMEHTLFHRSKRLGFSNVRWAFVMYPEFWSELVKYLPCEMVGDGCTGGVINANDGATGMFNMARREAMLAAQAITVNGRTYPVLLDDFIPVTTNVGPPVTYTSTIFFVPFTVDGEVVLRWVHKDYRAFVDVFRDEIPNGGIRSTGWTDGGRFVLDVKDDFPCVQIWSKSEMGLEFRAPHLAGRIDAVTIDPELAPEFPPTPELVVPEV